MSKIREYEIWNINQLQIPVIIEEIRKKEVAGEDKEGRRGFLMKKSKSGKEAKEDKKASGVKGDALATQGIGWLTCCCCSSAVKPNLAAHWPALFIVGPLNERKPLETVWNDGRVWVMRSKASPSARWIDDPLKSQVFSCIQWGRVDLYTI